MKGSILKISLLSLAILLFRCNEPARLPATTKKTNDTTIKNATDSINSNHGRQNEILTSGVGFTASGNEPFWSLEIDFNKYMHFKTAAGFEITTPVPEYVKAMDANATRYAAKTEQGLLTVQIAKQQCTNDMSGKNSDYKITVDVKSNTDKNYTTYKGCGNYITDYRLHDIWALEDMNGQPIGVQQYGKERPHIEINSSQNTFMGSAGNHEISGKISFEKGLLRFTDIEVPLNLSYVEKGFIKNLQSATGYIVENNRLLLFNPSGELLKFRKTD
ncbi:hypothetical protein BH11BAC3_BH11BAC3_43750 [soil metagenome]